MILEIEHRTTYSYSEPVRESVMEVRKRPRALTNQRILDFRIETLPQTRIFSHEDWLDNHVHHFDVLGPHQILTILSRARVEMSAPLALPDLQGRDIWSRLSSHEVKTMCWDYLAPTKLTGASAHLADFVANAGIKPDRDLVSSLENLNHILSEQIEYVPGLTHAHSHIDEALSMKKGVCQDYAHIFLAIARSWGVPSRYVSGYLAADQAHRDRSTADASHAWVECLFPDHGWVGFDPTNDMLACARHVVLGFGRDYADVPPAHGVTMGGATSSMEVEVSVRETRHASQINDGTRLFKAQREKPQSLQKSMRLGPVATAIQAMAAQQQQQ